MLFYSGAWQKIKWALLITSLSYVFCQLLGLNWYMIVWALIQMGKLTICAIIGQSWLFGYIIVFCAAIAYCAQSNAQSNDHEDPVPQHNVEQEHETMAEQQFYQTAFGIVAKDAWKKRK